MNKPLISCNEVGEYFKGKLISELCSQKYKKTLSHNVKKNNYTLILNRIK